MSTIIGADAAKLAGLQIDQLQKVREGQITLDHIEWFNHISKETRDSYTAGFVLPGGRVIGVAPKPEPPAQPLEKFGLLADLGIITVPADYKPVTEFAGMSFANPTRVLKPGDKLWVRAHKQIVDGTTTSEEHLAYLATLHSYLVGAQGIEIVEPYRRKLPKGFWYTSFDVEERLPLDVARDLRVPGVLRDSFHDFGRGLGDFEVVWLGSDAVLSFCDPALRPSDA